MEVTVYDRDKSCDEVAQFTSPYPRQTIVDILKAIIKLANSLQYCTDEIVIKEPENYLILEKLLNDVGIVVQFAQLHSPEFKYIKHYDRLKRCKICLCVSCPNGKPLLRCANS